jgi:hypothetical protein
VALLTSVRGVLFDFPWLAAICYEKWRLASCHPAYLIRGFTFWLSMICNFLDSSSILCITFLSSLNILAKFLQSTINLTMDRLLLKIFFQVFSLVQLMISPFKVSNNGAKIGLNNGHLSKKCIRFSSSVFTERTVRIYVRDRPFNLQGGGYGFLFRSEIF